MMKHLLALVASALSFGVASVVLNALTGGPAGFSPTTAWILAVVFAMAGYWCVMALFDERKRAATLREHEKHFFPTLFPEIGPEACKHDGCKRRRIAFSVMCAKHHYEMIKGKPCPEGGADVDTTSANENESIQDTFFDDVKSGTVLVHFYFPPFPDEEYRLMLESVPQEAGFGKVLQIDCHDSPILAYRYDADKCSPSHVILNDGVVIPELRTFRILSKAKLAAQLRKAAKR